MHCSRVDAFRHRASPIIADHAAVSIANARAFQEIEQLRARLEVETNIFTNIFYRNDFKMLGRKALLFVPEDDLKDLLGKLHDYLPVAVAGSLLHVPGPALAAVAVAVTHLTVLATQEAVVADRHAMRVASQVVQCVGFYRVVAQR